MHTIGLLEQAIDLARRSGYELRQEWLGGMDSGGCEINGRKVLFLDLALPPSDQLEQALGALRHDPEAVGLPMPHELRDLLQVRKSA